jgi:hypothetical protein
LSDNDNLIEKAQEYLTSAASSVDAPQGTDAPSGSDALLLGLVGTGFAVLASGHAISKQIHLLRKAVEAQTATPD